MDGELQPQMRENADEIRQLQAPAAGEAPNARSFLPLDRGSWIRLLGWMTLPGLFLGIIGPFGSFEAPLDLRLLYWVPTMAAGVLIGWMLGAWLDRQAWAQYRPFLRVASLTVLMAGAMIGVVWGWAWVVFARDVIPVSLTLVLNVLVVSGAMALLVSLVERMQTTQGEPAPAETGMADPQPPLPPQSGRSALASRLKSSLRDAKILALEAEDHYVRVHTDQGSDLILIRLTDAIAEMAPVQGARTHRSWWVARAAVVSVKRDNGRMILELTNGAAAPVSRSSATELTSLGWWP